ncbi:MAG: hypothetical protein PHC75_06950 [Burkholderiales bacterium]|nr:hypothetical protein [Burkholderiales bacterium]
MWVILAGVAASIIALAAVFNLRHDSPLSATRFEKSNAELVAGNIVNYATAAKLAIADLNTGTSVAIAASKIKDHLPYVLNDYVDYKAAVIKDTDGAIYELVTWNEIISQTFSKKTNNDMILVSLSSKFDMQDSVAPLIMVNENCKFTARNTYAQKAELTTKYTTLMNTICKKNSIKDFHIGKYNILIKISDSK